jgi:hypothetical protein
MLMLAPAPAAQDSDIRGSTSEQGTPLRGRRAWRGDGGCEAREIGVVRKRVTIPLPGQRSYAKPVQVIWVAVARIGP